MVSFISFHFFSFYLIFFSVVVVHMMLRSRTMVPFRVKAARPERSPSRFALYIARRIRNNIFSLFPFFFSARFLCVQTSCIHNIIYLCLLYTHTHTHRHSLLKLLLSILTLHFFAKSTAKSKRPRPNDQYQSR